MSEEARRLRAKMYDPGGSHVTDELLQGVLEMNGKLQPNTHQTFDMVYEIRALRAELAAAREENARLKIPRGAYEEMCAKFARSLEECAQENRRLIDPDELKRRVEDRRQGLDPDYQGDHERRQELNGVLRMIEALTAGAGGNARG